MLKVNDENGSIERKYDALNRVTEYTDDNGLYYMRQRYYNPEIKRFVNQDILTGSIGNSQSLNRYSYVQGNPVSYTDPFGLSPLNGLFSGTMLTHTVCELLGWIPGLVGSIANAVDGLVYLLVDKDYKNALYSLGSSVSFGAGKLVAWAGKGSKTALRIQRVCNFAGSAINFAQSAEGTVNMGGMMIDKYIIQGQPVSGTTAMEFLFLGANIFGATKSGAAIATDVRDFGKFVKGSWTKNSGIPYLSGNNAGFVDAKALKDAFKGKSGKTSTTPVDVYSFGNKTEPRGARPQQDFNVGSFDDIVGPESGPLPKGASNVTDINNSPLTRHYHLLPAGTQMPNGLDIIADGIDIVPNSPHGVGHYTIFPTEAMTVSKFNELYKSLPWQYGGKK